jgi:hypothetical protein
METSHKPRYFGDGEDTFSKTEWERELWSLLRERYAEKYRKSRESGTPFDHFFAPDYETIVECEAELRARGVQQTYRN